MKNNNTIVDKLIENNFDWDNKERYYLRPKDVLLYLKSSGQISNKINSSTIGRALKKMRIGFKECRSRMKFYKMPKVFEHIVSEQLYKSWNFERVDKEDININIDFEKEFYSRTLEELINIRKDLLKAIDLKRNREDEKE